MGLKLPDLKKHVAWFNETRPYLKDGERGLQKHEALWQINYGGLNDSANNKVSVYSVTVMAPNRAQEHFDCFFDQSSIKDKEEAGTPKKDGQTGIYFLGELLDPEKSPKENMVSVFKYHYPDTSHLLLL